MAEASATLTQVWVSAVSGGGRLAAVWDVPAGSVPGAPPVPPSSFVSAGSGSALGMSAVLAFGLIAAHRAWVLRRPPGDECALSGPRLGIDVSPD